MVYSKGKAKKGKIMKTYDMRFDAETMAMLQNLKGSVLKSIRSDARFSSLPILVYSGMLDEHRIKEVLEYGATDTADKGNPQDLVDKINLHARTR